MNYLDFILIVSLVVNILLIVGVRNLLKQTEQLETSLTETTNSMKYKIQAALQELRNADIRGSFESDDEVGAAFKELKNIVENLNETI
jgi:competence protein ComGC